MTKDCSTCIYKEGSCYPSTTIFDKDKTCKSYDPDYEGYITELEKENEKLKVENAFCEKACEGATIMYKHLTKAKEIIQALLNNFTYPIGREDWTVEDKEIVDKAEQFLSEVEK